MRPPHTRPSATPSRRTGAVDRPIAASLRLPADHLSLIDDSHARCVALGLSRLARPDYAPLGHAELQTVRERNRRLFAHAAPVMELLFDQIRGAQNMVVLCDATGTILHSIGDDDFLERASKVALQPGVNWSEPMRGTNAIGTALMDERSTLVHADEHFLQSNQFLTCSATPILDPRGQVLGVLDVTGDHRSYHPHTMGLIQWSARMIENHWLQDDCRNALRLQFHTQAEGIGTLMEGLVGLAADGRVMAANRSAQEQLGLSVATLRTQNVLTLFGTTVQTLVDHFRSALAGPLALRTPQGTVVQVVARFDGPAWAESIALGLTRRALGAPPANGPQELGRGNAHAHAAAAADGKAGETAGTPPLPQRSAALVSPQQWRRLLRVTDAPIPLVIEGAMGTGKTTLARALHAASRRRHLACLVVPCTEPEALLQRRLWGSDGVLAHLQQHGGTLVLEDVEALPASGLAQLLTDAGALPNCGWISTSREALEIHVQNGRLSADAYFRIKGLLVRLNPLNRHPRFADLVNAVIQDLCPHRAVTIDGQALNHMQDRGWAGNLHELQQGLRTALALLGDGPCIRLEHLPDEWCAQGCAAEGSYADDPTPPPRPLRQQERSLRAVEQQAMLAAVQACGGNMTAAARQLGVSRNTLYRKLRWAEHGRAPHPLAGSES